jgi:hypothetical protein
MGRVRGYNKVEVADARDEPAFVSPSHKTPGIPGGQTGGGGGLAETPTLKIRGAKRGLWGGVRMR